MGLAHQRIEQSAMAAVSTLGSIPPLQVEHPVVLRKEMVERHPIPNPMGRPGMRVIDGRTYEVTADTVEAAFLGS
jgi:hypothetical protein